MSDHFDPGAPLRSFVPEHRGREGRRPGTRRYVEADGARWVVKSLAGAKGSAQGLDTLVARELEGLAAFRELGERVLAPVYGPAVGLELEIDGERVRIPDALVFPFKDGPTLWDRLRDAADPGDLLREAGERIARRHRRATRLAQIHSDGTCHNVFADWTWLDFSSPHQASDLDEARAREVWRFLASVLELTPLGGAHARVAAFCEGYADRAPLSLAARIGRRRWPLLTVLIRPVQVYRLARGETKLFSRIRTARSLDAWLRRRRR